MDGKAYRVGAPRGGLIEIAFVPLVFPNQFDRVRKAESAQYEFLSVRAYQGSVDI